MIGIRKQKIVIIGNGMVGYKFCEKLIEKGAINRFDITIFGEEPRVAYDRVHLSEYFSTQSEDKLTMAPRSWYEENGIELYTDYKVSQVNRAEKYIMAGRGKREEYDYLIFATGSYPFVPPIPGIDKKGVFVYRTIEDLEGMMAYAKNIKSAAVIGGGLLGLEAAKALKDLKLETHVVEFAQWLMARQLNEMGAKFLYRKIEDLGVRIHLNTATDEILGDEKVEGMRFKDEGEIDVGMVVVSAGIRPRDDLAKECGLEIGPRGGIIVNNLMQTSDESIYAIGECALAHDFIYGLVAPGYQMAEVVASNLIEETKVPKEFLGADMSTKLKLMGVDVASFGNPFDIGDHVKSIIAQDEIKGIYKRILIDNRSNTLIGGVLVGDADVYGQLLQLCQNAMALPEDPASLIMDAKTSEGMGVGSMPGTATICSCENVSKDAICAAMDDGQLTASDLKTCTKAGTGCGGCAPLLNDLIDWQKQKMGVSVKRTICGCFDHTRQELTELIRKEELRSYWEVLGKYGKGQGCEICKPAVASILASYQNEYILKHRNIQDTNDRFLANMQRNGSYSVVPRVPGGEITPDQLIAIGEIAKEFDLYTKITGGQRIDMFGARMEDLPEIWRRLRDVGMESGHAYAKSLRTVKSCVGSTWCRFGVQDSVGLAIRIENRYKGLRSPHKLKSAVSGCTRECAEAQCKDFGIICTDKGYNLFVCGNGGMKPQHAQLLAEDLDEETLIKYIDRFLMYYIQTADRLTRTSVWLNKFPGGIKRLYEIVVEDALGITQELEQEMERHVGTYECEWAQTLDNPEMMKKFQPFVNVDEKDETIQFVKERGQIRPVNEKDKVMVQESHV